MPMNFSDALAQCKLGAKIQRDGWNGKGLYVALQKPDEHSANTLPYLYMVYPVYKIVGAKNNPGLGAEVISVGSPVYPNGARVPWLASQTDLLAEDWMVVS